MERTDAPPWRVLVAAADPSHRDHLHHLLSSRPGLEFRLSSAASAAEAIAGSQAVDCVVLHESFAGAEPQAFLARLCGTRRCAHCAVVVVTPAAAGRGTRGEWLRAGAAEVLPAEALTAEALAAAITDAINRHCWLATLGPSDIARDSTEQQLRDSESLLRTFYETCPLLMGVIELPDDDSNIFHIYANPAAEAFLGTAPISQEERNAISLGIPEAALKLWIGHYRTSQRTGRPVRFEYVHPSGDGDRWLATVVAFIGRTDHGRTRFSYVTDDVTAGKRIEEDLRDGRQQLAMTLRAGQLGSWDWHIPSGRVNFGGNWAKMLGYQAGEIEPHVRGWQRLIHPDDTAAVTAVLTDHLEGRSEFYECEHRLRHKDGSWRWILARGQVVERDAGDNPVRAIGTHADITARRQTAERLRENEERFRLLVDASSQMVWQATPEGEVVEESASWTLFTGQSATNWGEVVHPDDLEATAAAWQASVKAGILHSHDCRIRRADGVWRWTRVIATPLRDDHGRVVKWVGMNIDITEQIEAAERLRQSELFHRQVLESIPGMTFTSTPDGACDFISQQWVEFTGMPVEQHLGDGWLLSIHPEDHPRTITAWQRAVANRGAYDLEYRIRRHDGTYEWFKVIGRAIRDSSGVIVRWFGAAMNVDNLVRAEAALREADRRKDEFLAMLAHELRNPLAPILTAVGILRMTSGKQHGAGHEIHDVIERQVHHLVRLVDDLLDVSRVSRGKIQLRKASIDLIGAVQQAVETHQDVINSRRHRLILDLPGHPVLIRGDFIRIAQIVGNLLNNAAKYSDEGGDIHLAVERTEPTGGPAAIIRVRDNGRGIDPSELTNLFGLFYQVDRTIDRSEGGLGIGLSLVKSLVTLHGGQIEARSEGRGRGSEFIVTLPVTAKAQAGGTAGEEQAAGGQASSDRLLILVVDDNHDSANSMSMLLRLKGHQVLTAHDGAQAAELAIAKRPSVTLLDIGLPKVSGYDACRAIRQAGLDDVLIVAMTGYGQTEDQRLSRQAGFDAHLVKPVDQAKLLDLLGRRQRRR